MLFIQVSSGSKSLWITEMESEENEKEAHG